MAEMPLLSAAALPVTRSEAITVMAHYYRGEMGRMAGWRDRLDRTSNWAITVVAAMLSLSLSTPTAHHSVLIFAMLLILLLLLIEARRYRFYDVYRDRVRLLERHYFAPALDGESGLDPAWVARLTASLRSPSFQVSWLGAMTRRLRRNYGWMYLILLMAWLLKITSPLLQPDAIHEGWRAPFENVLVAASAGPVPGWMVICLVAALYAAIGWMLFQPDNGKDFEAGEVHL